MHYPGRAPNQRFRIEQYTDYLRENGIDCEFSYLLNEKDDRVFYAPGNFIKKTGIAFRSLIKRRRDVRRATNFDAVMIVRESVFIGPAFIEKRLKKKGVKIIYDFDDAIWKLDVSRSNRFFGFLKFPAKTSSIIRLADAVVAGNEYLANYALQYNNKVRIIPTTVDTEYLKREQENPDKTPLVIGWSGSLTTIKHFELATEVLKKIKSRYGDKVSFHVIGDKSYNNRELQLQGRAWSASSEKEELEKIDIGIMPLPDDEWSNGKCGLKGLVYMSLGIPTVMSAVGVNTRIIKNGENGFLPKTEKEWEDTLAMLIENPELRKHIGSMGRKTVEEQYSVLSQREKYLQLFREI